MEVHWRGGGEKWRFGVRGVFKGRFKWRFSVEKGENGGSVLEGYSKTGLNKSST